MLRILRFEVRINELSLCKGKIVVPRLTFRTNRLHKIAQCVSHDDVVWVTSTRVFTHVMVICIQRPGYFARVSKDRGLFLNGHLEGSKLS